MTEENKKEKCKCCLGLGIIVLIVGVILGVTGSAGFGLPQGLAIGVGIILILLGIKKTKMCKCCNK
jgi:multisubunit Na+/H+ antiporter MnhB subunit